MDDGWQTVDGGERNRVGLAFPLRSPRAALEEYLRGLNASMQETMLAVARFSAGNRTLSEFVSDLAESSPWDVLSAAAPAQPPPSAPPKAANPAAELTSSAMNLAMRLFTAFYATFVAPAPYDSLIARLWRWASAGPLRANLIAFFDEHTDFSKSLVSFAPNAKFSDGGDAGGGLPGVKPSLSLASMVSQLRSELGIRTVYAWHALGGYWSGVSPIAPEMAPLEPEWRFPEPARDLLMVEPAVLWDPSSFHGAGTIDPSHFDRFFDGVHGALAAAGVDGVKVDAQSGIAVFGSGWGLGQPAYVRRAVRAMERSARAHFSRGGREGESASEVICCMCHSSENLLSFHDAAVVRCGDDFYPNDEASHAAHITTVAYNSVLLGELAVPDWDMFQSAGTAADLHAAARALGGGAIYVSDKPGEHCFELLRQLVLPDGSTLRALRAGRCACACAGAAAACFQLRSCCRFQFERLLLLSVKRLLVCAAPAAELGAARHAGTCVLVQPRLLPPCTAAAAAAVCAFVRRRAHLPSLPRHLPNTRAASLCMRSRARRTRRPTVDCLFDDVARDGRTALKVWNSNAVTGLLGAFNVQGSEWSRRLRRFVQPLSPRAPVPLTLSPSLVAEPRFQAGQHALYSFRTSELRAPVGAGEAQRYAQLREGEWDIFTVAPVQTLSLGRAGSGPAREHVAWAPLGLLRMLNGGGAVVEARTDADGRAAIVRARGCGTFGMFVSRAPAEVAVGGARVSGAQHDAHSNLLRFELGELPAEGELHEIVVRF